MQGHAAIGVSVQIMDKKGKKKGKPVSTLESEKISNYDILKRLGFDKDYLE